jgi:hypothetical protein
VSYKSRASVRKRECAYVIEMQILVVSPSAPTYESSTINCKSEHADTQNLPATTSFRTSRKGPASQRRHYPFASFDSNAHRASLRKATHVHT